VRFVREPLDSPLGPSEALRFLRAHARPFALLGAWAGGGALLGSEPLAFADARDDPFAVLDDQPEVTGAVPGAVGGGWFGYLGYSLGERVERLPPPPPRRTGLPAFSLAFYDHVLRLDSDGRWWFEALWEPARDRRLRERLDLLRGAMAGPAPAARGYKLGAFTPRPGRRAHAEAVEWCRRYIAAGDLYQANLCLRLEAGFEGDALDLFTTAAGALAPDRAAYLAGPWGAVASLSPELFLRRSGRSVLTAPIKGTAQDRAVLSGSAKDRAENVMIVDLMRNDIGKSCAYGSVSVPQLARPTAGPGVWHLVSEVTGELAPGVGDGDLVRGCFPPGSVTGAPKIKALQVISELESTAREVYTGAIGFASPLAGLELSVAIRSFEVAGGSAWLGAGGGITWGSDPDGEYRECLTKARPLIEAAGGSLADEPGTVGPPLPVAPSRRARPDPARGVFETLLAVDGEVLLLDEHLQRLEASVWELYGERLPPGLGGSVQSSVTEPGAWRVRVAVRPGGDVEIERVPATFPDAPLELRPLVLPGGLGPHKWLDREVLAGPGEALLVDLGGELLETGSGNLFLVEGDTLVTPPADGRLLPGVTRAEILRLADVSVEPIDIERARGADEVFVTSSIRGAQAVAGCEGIGEWPIRGRAAALATRLRTVRSGALPR
jgi:para-aminobenzoate synthetase/4-amino-4-deoxychorismate lyase